MNIFMDFYKWIFSDSAPAWATGFIVFLTGFVLAGGSLLFIVLPLELQLIIMMAGIIFLLYKAYSIYKKEKKINDKN